MKRSEEKMLKWGLGLLALAGVGYLGYEKVLPARYRVKVGSTVNLKAGTLQSNTPFVLAQNDVVTVKVTADGGNVWNGTLTAAGINAVPVSFPKTADVVSVA